MGVEEAEEEEQEVNLEQIETTPAFQRKTKNRTNINHSFLLLLMWWWWWWW